MDFVIEALPENPRRNAGCCLLKYETHALALDAIDKIGAIFQEPVTIQWCNLVEEPVDEATSNVIHFAV